LGKLLLFKEVREDCEVWESWQFAGSSQWVLAMDDGDFSFYRKSLAESCERDVVITAE
jgi:hypothetical protein